jgi:alkylresorcinol/alkylpyrone synthase
VTGEGFKVILSRDIPSIVTDLVEKNIQELVVQQGITVQEIGQFVAHPGGTKVLQAYCDGLGITDQELRHSLGVLRDFGNMSSATIFFILERFLQDRTVQPGSFGLLSALGPGFSSELVLVRWP